jgi:hypothetical protein
MTASAHDPKAPPDILSGSEIYDHIMGEIEPELVIAELSHIAERTKAETPEQRKARAERYTKAFAEYDTRFKQYAHEWNRSFQHYRSFSFHTLEEFTNNTNQTYMDTIVDSIHKT